MFFLHHPSESEIIHYLLKQREATYTYPQVGATQGALPGGYNIDRHRIQLGSGAATFAAARRALTAWKMYPTPMTELCFPDRPVAQGTVVAALIKVGPIWSLNPCRIVYTVDAENRTDGVRRFGFAVGTLAGHAECGEERFLVEWHPADDSVWYELLAFSRPQQFLVKCLFPYARWIQSRFRQLSGASMVAASANAASANAANETATSGSDPCERPASANGTLRAAGGR